MTSEGREWEFFRPEGEGRQVEREILKLGLSKWEAGRLADVMDRALERRLLPREVKPLRDGVFEIILNGHNRSFRLMFAEVRGGMVLLALKFISKKKQVDRDAVEVAVKRLKDWQRRHL